MSVCRWARVRVRTLAYTPADLAQYAEMNKHILYRPHILEWTVSFKLHTNIFFLYEIFFSISFRLFIVWNGKNYVNALHLLAISVEASNRKLKSTCMNDATNLSSFPQIFLCLQCTQSNRTKPRYLYELSRKSDPNYFRFFFLRLSAEVIWCRMPKADILWKRRTINDRDTIHPTDTKWIIWYVNYECLHML